MITKSCSNRVPTALEFSFDMLKFRSIVLTSQNQQFYGVFNFQTIFNRGKRQYDRITMMHYKCIDVYRISKFKLVWNLWPPKNCCLCLKTAYLTKILTQVTRFEDVPVIIGQPNLVSSFFRTFSRRSLWKIPEKLIPVCLKKSQKLLKFSHLCCFLV